MFENDADSPSSLLSQIKSSRCKIDKKLGELQENNSRIKEQQDEEIKNLVNEKKEIENRIKENSIQMLIENEINKLKQKKSEAEAQKQSYLNQIEDYKQRLKHEKESPSKIDFGATLEVYKTIAPVLFFPKSSNTINGSIAFGTFDTTKYFKYSMNMASSIPNEFWNDVMSLYEIWKSNKSQN